MFSSHGQRDLAETQIYERAPSKAGVSQMSPIAKDVVTANFKRSLLDSYLVETPAKAPQALKAMKDPKIFNMVKEMLFRRGLVLEARMTEKNGDPVAILRPRHVADFLPTDAKDKRGRMAVSPGMQLTHIEMQAEFLFHELNDGFIERSSKKKLSANETDEHFILAKVLGTRPEMFGQVAQRHPSLFNNTVMAASQYDASVVFVPVRNSPFVLPKMAFELDRPEPSSLPRAAASSPNLADSSLRQRHEGQRNAKTDDHSGD